MRRWLGRVLAIPALLIPAIPAGAAELAATRPPNMAVLRVCADGNMMPFSNQAGEGFENRIARMIADELGVGIEYTWWPQTIGFVRNTLKARRCDLVIGTASGEEQMQNTNPYYRSAYALVYRADSGVKARTLDDPVLALLRVGVVERTPPATLLTRYGLHNIVPYQLNVDTRTDQPARAAIEDVANKALDVAVVWGPIAGWYAAAQPVPLVVMPLVSDARGPFRLDFRISMGIRPDEPEWKHWLNDFIRRRQGDIDRLLAGYHVPMLAADGAVMVPAPEGYRMDDYRAPTPRTVPGGKTVTTGEVRRMRDEGRAILVDVLPRPPRPADLPAGAVWTPKAHRTLPGATWLPNVGFGALSEDMDRYFRTNLEKLTQGRKDAPLVIFCERDCWQSWNAVKRAAGYGYTALYWYPDGTNGWAESGLDLIEAEPVPPSRS